MMVLLLYILDIKIKTSLNCSNRRGCQPPWNMHRSVNLPPCTNLTHMRDWFYHYGKGWDNYERANYSPIESVRKTGCPLPCTSAAFK